MIDCSVAPAVCSETPAARRFCSSYNVEPQPWTSGAGVLQARRWQHVALAQRQQSFTVRGKVDLDEAVER